MHVCQQECMCMHMHMHTRTHTQYLMADWHSKITSKMSKERSSFIFQIILVTIKYKQFFVTEP